MEASSLKKGLIKGVFSGDLVFLQGKIGKSGLPLEKKLRLIGLTSPSVATNAEGEEQDVGFEAREFLRKILVGKDVEFDIETTIGKQEYGRVLLNGKDVAVRVLEEGLAELTTVIESTKTKPVNLELYEKARHQAKQAKKGIFAESKQPARKIEKHPDLAAFNEKNKGKVVKGVVEDINGQSITVFVNEGHLFIKTHVSDLNIPIISYAHVQDLRCYLEERLLHRDVELTIKKFDGPNSTFYVDFKLANGLDVKLELLKGGFAKLSNESLMELDVNVFKNYKEAMEDAQRQKLRIWKEYKPTVKNSKKEDTVFYGRVVEIKSGDNLIIENPDNAELKRYYLANIKAPQVGNFRRGEADKPYAFESKEFLRTLTIGKKVKVEIEFSKTIQKPLEEDKKESEVRVFISLFLNDKNVSETLLENGLVSVAPPRVDEEFSKYLKQMREAEDRGKAAKAGIHSGVVAKIMLLNDMSIQKNVQKLKQFYSFIKEEKKLTGVIELVLSGSRYKVRVNQQNCMFIIVLHGVKCLSNDKNVKEYEIFSNKALSYARDNLLQRDVTVELEACDNRGLFHGNVLVNKKSFASSLIEAGLAYTFTAGGSSGSRYQSEYQKLEQTAKSQRVGMWKESAIKLESSDSMKSYKELKEKKVGLQVSEIVSGNEFYLQDPKSKNLALIEKTLAEFDPESEKQLAAPIKVGTPCVAEFYDDSKWYRARIERHVRGTKYLVFFLDYGNSDEIDLDDIRVMPTKLLSIEPQARRCALANVLVPKLEHEIGESVTKYLRDQLWEKSLEAHFVYEDEGISYALLYFQGKTDVKQSINFNLILKGFAKVDKRVKLPAELAFWQQEEENAVDNKLGLWAYGDEFSDEGEDY